MKVIKKINNNYALAYDDEGSLVVVNGLGVGFGVLPRTIDDRNIVKVYRNIDEAYLLNLGKIPNHIMAISEKVVDYAYEIIPNQRFSSNFIFTFADHIQFTIERFKAGNVYDFDKYYDFTCFYDNEIKVANYCYKLIENNLNIKLPSSERGGFVANILNAEFNQNSQDKEHYNCIINNILDIIESELNKKTDKERYSFSRFYSHMVYLIKRIENGEINYQSEENSNLYNEIKLLYPRINECAYKVASYLSEKYKVEINDNEVLYLILYINRLS